MHVLNSKAKQLQLKFVLMSKTHPHSTHPFTLSCLSCKVFSISHCHSHFPAKVTKQSLFKATHINYFTHTHSKVWLCVCIRLTNLHTYECMFVCMLRLRASSQPTNRHSLTKQKRMKIKNQKKNMAVL